MNILDSLNVKYTRPMKTLYVGQNSIISRDFSAFFVWEIQGVDELGEVSVVCKLSHIPKFGEAFEKFLSLENMVVAQ